MISSHAKGLLITGIGVFVISPDSLLIRLVSVDHWTLLFWRGLLMSIGLMVIMRIVGGGPIGGRFRSIGRGGIGVAAMSGGANVLFVIAISHTNVANVLVILSAGPIIAALLSRLVMREATARHTWGAGIVVMGAIAGIFFGSLGRGDGVGDLLALGAVLLLSGSLTLTRAHRTVDMTPALALSAVMSAGVASAFASPLEVPSADVAILLVAGLILLPSAIALLIQGPRLLPAPEVSLVLLLEMVLGTCWVWVWLGETPSQEALMSATVIVGTVVVHSIIQWRQSLRMKAAVS